MNFRDLIEQVIDELHPAPNGFPSLEYLEQRHILRAFLFSGSIMQASPLLGLCVKTVQNKMHEMFPPAKILALPLNRGRSDVGYIIEYAASRMPSTMKLPPASALSPVWRNNRIRALGLHAHKLDGDGIKEIMHHVVDPREEELFYPCHRDFEFWDNYQNLDVIHDKQIPGAKHGP